MFSSSIGASTSIGGLFLDGLIQHWRPHPGWPRPALVASRPHPWWPCPALAASSWMASSSIGSLILDGLFQHWQYNLGWRQIIVEFYFSLFINEIYNNLPMIPRWLLSRAGTLAKIMMKANYCIILFYTDYEWNLQQFALLVEAIQDEAARLPMLVEAIQDETANAGWGHPGWGREAANAGRGHPGWGC